MSNNALRSLYTRRVIFSGDLSAGIGYRQARRADPALFNRMRKALDRRPPAVMASVDLVVLGNRYPRSPVTIEHLTEGLDLLHEQFGLEMSEL